MQKSGLPFKFSPSLGATLVKNSFDFYNHINEQFHVYDVVVRTADTVIGEATKNHLYHLSRMRDLILGVTTVNALDTLVKMHYDEVERIHINPETGQLNKGSFIMEFCYSIGKRSNTKETKITTIFVTADLLRASAGILNIIVRKNSGFVFQQTQEDPTGSVGMIADFSPSYGELHVKFRGIKGLLPITTYECILLDYAMSSGKPVTEQLSNQIVGQMVDHTPILAVTG